MGEARTDAATIAESSGSVPSPSTNERSILSDVDGQALEGGQRGVAGAEVVDGDVDAEVLERARASARPLAGAHQRALGDLQAELLGSQAGAARCGAPPRRRSPGSLELARRDVDGDRSGAALRAPARRPGGSVCAAPSEPSGPISPVSSASGMNSAGDTAPSARVRPAGERLDAGDAAGLQVDLRLVVERERHRLERRAQLLLELEPATIRRRVASEKSSTRSLPSSLAWYMATSASRSSASAPTLASPPPTGSRCWRGRARRWPAIVERLRRARRAGAAPSRSPRARPATPSHRTVNSSPPRRATSVARRARRARSRSATCAAGGRPASWPKLSLTSLKSSRSRKSTASAPPSGGQRPQAVEEQRAVGQAGERVVGRRAVDGRGPRISGGKRG